MFRVTKVLLTSFSLHFHFLQEKWVQTLQTLRYIKSKHAFTSTKANDLVSGSIA
jgi:hypothetical protein